MSRRPVALIIAILLLFSAPAHAEAIAVMKVDDRNIVTLTDEPCKAPKAAAALKAEGVPAQRGGYRRATVVYDGRKIEACYAPHLEPVPHVDISDSDGDGGSVPIEMFAPVTEAKK